MGIATGALTGGIAASARRGDNPMQHTIALALRDQRLLEIRVKSRDEWLAKLATIEGVTVVR